MSSALVQSELPITVVIATLGGDILINTIKHLNEGEGKPLEVLICIPESHAQNAECVSQIQNVHIVKTNCKGQVAQRAAGLTLSKCPYVMQLDDDVILAPDALLFMYKTLTSMGRGNVIAPFFRIQPTGREGTEYIGGLRGFIRACHATFVCGAAFGPRRFGKIASSGIGYGVLMSSGETRIIESEWLPGGVALCHREDVIDYDYFPFKGKAFSEDLIHSILWRKQGCRLWTALDVSAMIDVTIESLDWSSIIERFKAHAYVAKLSGGKVWLTHLWLAVYCIFNIRGIFLQNILKKKNFYEV